MPRTWNLDPAPDSNRLWVSRDSGHVPESRTFSPLPMDPDLSVMNTRVNPALRTRFDIALSADSLGS